jgi:hypothetical protein
MRVSGLALAGVLAATAALADQQRNMGAAHVPIAGRTAAPASGAHAAPAFAGRSPAGLHRREWQPYPLYGGRGPYAAWGAPAYWVWVPGSAVFDYPFADWREPIGGWGNP